MRYYSFPLNPYNQQRQYQKPVWVYPAHLAMYATYLRNEGHDVKWDSDDDDYLDAIMEADTLPLDAEVFKIRNDFQIEVPFEKLPYPDRVFTDAKNPRWQSYGNYKRHPATQDRKSV